MHPQPKMARGACAFCAGRRMRVGVEDGVVVVFVEVVVVVVVVGMFVGGVIVALALADLMKVKVLVAAVAGES